MKYFYSSFIITSVGLAIAFILGFTTNIGISPIGTAFTFIYITILLAVLEVSLSFDNAVKNAVILKEMDEIWQKRFILWGMPIAVFGMRFIFPIMIVMIASGQGLFQTFDMAMNDPKAYHSSLEHSINYIYAFGGSFLMMVALEFFFDSEKQEYWLNIIENNKIMKKSSNIPSIEITIALVIGLVVTYFTKDFGVSLAFFTGVLLYTLLTMVDQVFSSNGVKNGLVGFLYLEVLDASFSFDGVISAFALSTNIFIIMIGLGIGAMFVRSLTLLFVHNDTLDEYKYLEHGAHYAIAALSVIMLTKIFVEIPEMVTGTIGIGFIAIAFISSVLEKKCNLEKK